MKSYKKTVIKLIAILVVLAANFSCEDDIKDIPLQYQKCDCDHEAKFLGTYEDNHILLLDAEKVTDNDIPKLSGDGKECIDYIMCNFTIKGALIISKCPGGMFGYGTICNFPFDKIVFIPKEGMYVSLTCDEYEECNPTMTFPEYSYSDIVLTTLKIYTK